MHLAILGPLDTGIAVNVEPDYAGIVASLLGRLKVVPPLLAGMVDPVDDDELIPVLNGFVESLAMTVLALVILGDAGIALELLRAVTGFARALRTDKKNQAFDPPTVNGGIPDRLIV